MIISSILTGFLLMVLFGYFIHLLLDWMNIQTSIWPNKMARGQRWRYWTHRMGYLWSPSCGSLGIPFADLKLQKHDTAYGWVKCAFCGWSSRHRKDLKGDMHPKNFKQYEKHAKTHKYPSRPLQFKHPTER